MHRYNRLLLALCLAGLTTVAAHAAPPSVLKAQMPASTFKAAGLDKLTPAELHTLEQWLRAHPSMQGDTATGMGAADVEHRPASPPEPKTMQSRVVGNFSGWQHDSIITLANGQQWQVIDDSELVAPNAGHPVATVKRAFLGSHLLTVEGFNVTARVKRIR